jgi:hypothetical protein
MHPRHAFSDEAFMAAGRSPFYSNPPTIAAISRKQIGRLAYKRPISDLPFRWFLDSALGFFPEGMEWGSPRT